MARQLTLAILFTFMLGLTWIGFDGDWAMADNGEPTFKLVNKEGDFEIRDYDPVVVAEITFAGDRDNAVSAGFTLLLNYISGDNQTKQKIAMTAPVTQTKSSIVTSSSAAAADPLSEFNSVWSIRFMMPQNASLKSLPKPGDPRIDLVNVPARRVAVFRFTGLWSDSNLAANRDKFLALLKTKGIKTVGEPTYAFYDPPWQPFFWRRNEIIWGIAPN